MRRSIILLSAVALLLAGAVVAERALQAIGRVDPMGRKLLYLPSAEMLKLASLGNAGLVADALYLWSIQYYSQYHPSERYLYLEPVFQLITDLDPLYHDAYRVGALIMQLPTTDEEENKRAVIRLFDKALRNMPENWRIAEAAGWDCFIRYRDRKEGIRYFTAAVAVPDAPHRLRRFLTVWTENEEGWSFDEAYRYWLEVLEESESDYDRAVCEKQIYRLFASRDEALLDPVLADWRGRTGSCPEAWQELVDAGALSRVPVDYFGQDYRILPESCSAMGLESVRFD